MADIGDIQPDDITSIPTFRAAYSDRTALLMARLAERAYTKFDVDDNSWTEFSRELGGFGLSQSTKLIDPGIGTAGFIVAGDEIIIVVFRGTEDELDWRSNVNLAWITLQGGVRVHTGFFQAYWPVRQTLLDTVSQLVYAKRRPVYITGHSLGGALATMATAELANHDDAYVRDCIAACYTFGSPRVGDSSFDQYVKVPLYRVTNGVDLVPAVPPWFFGFRHVGDTRYFGKPGIAPLRRSPNIVQKTWRTLRGLPQFLGTFKLLNIADHNMRTYVSKLFAWAEELIKETKDRREETAAPKESKRK